MDWVYWALLLLVQNAAFTWVSRARNSGSLKYHAIASVFSNGVWFISNLVVLKKGVDALNEGINRGDWGYAIAIGLFYTLFTVIGSISMHYISMTYLEKGKRKVGS